MKICIATGTRAEFGLLKPLMSRINDEPGWELQILATGAHLSPEFGLTYKAIEDAGFTISKKVEMLLSADTSVSIVKSMGMGMIGYADALNELKPDLLIVLGDRYEMLAVVSSALILTIPVAHLHGGEITEGAYDDAIRHSITKMAHLHFASTEQYRKRILQMGEDPACTYNVGAIGLDNILNMELKSKVALEKDLQIKFRRYNYQITFHPSTLDPGKPEEQFKTLLEACDEQDESFFIFTKANADTGGRVINEMIDEYVIANPERTAAFSSLGTLRFLSLVKHCDAIIGNSSSGIIEAPSLQTATINIGDRQKGRIQAESVINVRVDKDEIKKALDLAKSTHFRHKLNKVANPYGKGGTTEKIIYALNNLSLKQLRIKKFFTFQNYD